MNESENSKFIKLEYVNAFIFAANFYSMKLASISSHDGIIGGRLYRDNKYVDFEIDIKMLEIVDSPYVFLKQELEPYVEAFEKYEIEV